MFLKKVKKHFPDLGEVLSKPDCRAYSMRSSRCRIRLAVIRARVAKVFGLKALSPTPCMTPLHFKVVLRILMLCSFNAYYCPLQKQEAYSAAKNFTRKMRDRM